MNGGTQRWLRLDVWRTDTRRESLRLLISILAGAVLIPALIWLIGTALLGKYPNGSLLALWGDFFVGLAHAGVAFLLVTAGPYLFLWLLRVWLAVLRS